MSTVGSNATCCWFVPLVITRSALIVVVAMPVMLVFAELSTTLTPTISAMPTISAAAVIAVRRGLRAELRLPSLPGTDQLKRLPSPLTTGRLMAGVSTAMPTNDELTPVTISASVLPPAPAEPGAEQRRAGREDQRADDR